MSFMTWTDDMSVGIDTLDDDHKQLFAILNRLVEGGGGGSSRQELQAMLGELVDYANDHFSREEAMLASRNYPDLAKHREIHADFTGQVRAMAEEFESSSNVMLKIDLILLLKDWLFDHILSTDMKYRPFVTGARTACQTA